MTNNTLMIEDTVFTFLDGLTEDEVNDLMSDMKKKGNKSFTYNELGSTARKSYDINELRYFYGIAGEFEFSKTEGSVHLGDRDKMDSIRRIRTNPKDQMSVVEAAAYVGFSEKHLRKLIKSGTIPSRKEGIRIVLELKDLDNYLKS